MASRYIVHYFDDKGERVGDINYNTPGEVLELITLFTARNPDSSPVRVKFGGGTYVFSKMETEIDGEHVFIRFAFQDAEEHAAIEAAARADAEAERAQMLAQLQGAVPGHGALPPQEFDFSQLGIAMTEDESEDE